MKVCRKSPVIEAFHFTEESVKHPGDWPTWLFLAATIDAEHSKNSFYFESVKSGIQFFLVDHSGSRVSLNYGDYILCDDEKLFVRSSPTFHAYWYEVK